jgi:hypothetical protein
LIILFLLFPLPNYFFALRRQEILKLIPFAVGLTPYFHLYSLKKSRISKNSLLIM